ncbi:hypothetical protein RclHR1_26230001 [Rhizophagus clarus]|uniref:Uncharacterized protein n=1 Tax=Rhizophagus clarus TaxID=94130 RepID=A0A2Z6R0C6_9GLOM|nr:hypothetical protein RclHR1_26230001 [Rhizophagus clarus]
MLITLISEFDQNLEFETGKLELGIIQDRSKTPLKADYMIFQSLEVLYRRTTVQKKWIELFQRSETLIQSGLSKTSLGTDYNISKILTFHFEDWTLFEGKTFDLFFLFLFNKC